MSDNAQFFNDLLVPFLSASPTAVTLATTDKALYPASAIRPMGQSYWWVGKKIKIRLFMQMTTAATPGNGTFDVYYGTGADANGTIIGAGTANTLVASQTNQTVQCEFTIRCTAIGPSGALLVTGPIDYTPAVVAAGGALMPASAPAPVTVDLTSASNVISVQYKRSGSTAETMQVVDMEVFALN